jgi:hypothetical protein
MMVSPLAHSIEQSIVITRLFIMTVVVYAKFALTSYRYSSGWLQLVISNYIVNSIVFCNKSRSHRLYSAVLQDIITFNTIVNSIVNSTVNTHLNTLSTSPLTPALSYEITVIDNQTLA